MILNDDCQKKIGTENCNKFLDSAVQLHIYWIHTLHHNKLLIRHLKRNKCMFNNHRPILQSYGTDQECIQKRTRCNISCWWFQPLWKILVKRDDYSQYVDKSHVPVTSSHHHLDMMIPQESSRRFPILLLNLSSISSTFRTIRMAQSAAFLRM